MNAIISIAFLLTVQGTQTQPEIDAIKFVTAVYANDIEGINSYIKNNCVPYTAESVKKFEDYSKNKKANIADITVEYVGPDILVKVVLERDKNFTTASYIFFITKFKWVGNKVYEIAFKEDGENKIGGYDI